MMPADSRSTLRPDMRPSGSIDHIAIPSGWSLWAVNVEQPHPDGRFLRDHTSYVAPVERAVVSTASNAP